MGTTMADVERVLDKGIAATHSLLNGVSFPRLK